MARFLATTRRRPSTAALERMNLHWRTMAFDRGQRMLKLESKLRKQGEVIGDLRRRCPPCVSPLDQQDRTDGSNHGRWHGQRSEPKPPSLKDNQQ
jgi:hypothetical protein